MMTSWLYELFARIDDRAALSSDDPADFSIGGWGKKKLPDDCISSGHRRKNAYSPRPPAVTLPPPKDGASDDAALKPRRRGRPRKVQP